MPPSLSALRAKWFLDFSAGGSQFPPKVRHSGSTVLAYTEGNKVTPLIDGQAYMKVWHDSIVAMAGKANAELYMAGWRLDDVRTLGEQDASSNAIAVLLKAGLEDDVKVFLVLSRHGFGLVPDRVNRFTLLQFPNRDGLRACLDNRFPPGGSVHQKLVCLKNPTSPKALVGSVDISTTRWDRTAHDAVDPSRRRKTATHDTGVQIEGPAVADLERTFRERWNDSSRTLGLEPVLLPQPMITSQLSSAASTGTHSVQVVHTYGITNSFYGYSWSPKGEFTLWASYLNAVKKASTFIYIEDQYFLPFDYFPCFTRQTAGPARDSDIIYQLGEAIKRGVKVAVLVPGNAEDAAWVYNRQKYQRDLGIRYLQSVATSSQNGDFVIAILKVDGEPVYVHSKLLICDDEFVLIGSGNVCQRSMTHDGEVGVGIVDEAGTFARQFRKALWAEHLVMPASDLDDPVAAYATFKSLTLQNIGRGVHRYQLPSAASPPSLHQDLIRGVIDPYAGPAR